MSVLNIVTIGDPILRETCMEVRKFNDNLCRLLDNMKETMVENDGVGLAAPQVGIPKRVVVLDVGDGLIELINPEIVEVKGTQTATEGCLSVPDEFAEVMRAQYVRIKADNRQGEPFEIEGEDLLARALLHEIDHLDGVLFIDKIIRDDDR